MTQINQMHDLLDRRILTSLIAITLMQSAIVMSSYGITVVVPDAAAILASDRSGLISLCDNLCDGEPFGRFVRENDRGVVPLAPIA